VKASRFVAFGNCETFASFVLSVSGPVYHADTTDA
jgi:hypothetical protein